MSTNQQQESNSSLSALPNLQPFFLGNDPAPSDDDPAPSDEPGPSSPSHMVSVNSLDACAFVLAVSFISCLSLWTRWVCLLVSMGTPYSGPFPWLLRSRVPHPRCMTRYVTQLVSVPLPARESSRLPSYMQATCNPEQFG